MGLGLGGIHVEPGILLSAVGLYYMYIRLPGLGVLSS